MAMIKLKTIKNNPNNPRIIKDDKFAKLCKSIQDLPKMMELRPIVIDENNIVQGGNMRLKALEHLGYKEIPETWVKMATDFTADELQEFIIKDNLGFGEWDWDDLANNWDAEKLNDWGLDLPNFNNTPVDYSILDEADISQELAEMASNVKKAIQIEFEIEHYEEAAELVKFWREQGLYIGGFLMEKLKDEKSKL